MAEATPVVLLLDDDPMLTRLLTLQLEAELGDVETIAAGTLAEGLAAPAVDCVVLDLSLVDGGGLEAIGRLRDGGVEAPVLVFSGRAELELPEEAAAAGAAGFVPKGADAGALAAAVRAVLGRS